VPFGVHSEGRTVSAQRRNIWSSAEVSQGSGVAAYRDRDTKSQGYRAPRSSGARRVVTAR
jgi:hypothetical protein